MKEIIIEVPDRFGQELKPEKVNSEIKGELVRCKDCRYYNSKQDSKGDHCDKIHWSRGIDWFCGDGKRRD